MKKTFVYFLLSFALVGTFSCETDSFLEDPKPTDEIAEVTPDLALVGMYSAYRDFYGGSHDVATSKSFYLGAEVMGRDLQVPDFNWYIFEHRWDVVESAQARRTYYAWEMNYKLVLHANQVLYTCDNNPSGNSPQTLNDYRGQALAMRANAYYNLIRTYQFTYFKDPSLPGVPLDLSIEDSNHKPRGTVQQVYDQMYADMNDAIALFQAGTNTRSAMHKYRVDLNVAKGLFARIALEKRDWALAARLASEARQGYNLMGNADYTAGFNDFGNAEWMWGFPYINSENFGFASFYSFIDHERGDGYKDIYVNSSFYNLFSATDVRRSLIVPGAPAPGKQWVTRKFRDLSDLSGHMVMMRASEMYLIQAEGLAYSDLPAAKQVLLQLAQQRDPNATLSSAATAAAFVEEVLVERRKELYGELGTDFFDMKRYQKDMTRTGNAVWNAVGFAVGQTVPATSNKWNLLIPLEEIDLNDAIGPEDQNPLD